MLLSHCGSGNCTVTFWTFCIASVCHSQARILYFLWHMWVTVPCTVTLFTIFIAGLNMTVSHSGKVIEASLFLRLSCCRKRYLCRACGYQTLLHRIWHSAVSTYSIFTLWEKGWRKSDRNFYVGQSYPIPIEIVCNNTKSGTFQNNAMN